MALEDQKISDLYDRMETKRSSSSSSRRLSGSPDSQEASEPNMAPQPMDKVAVDKLMAGTEAFLREIVLDVLAPRRNSSDLDLNTLDLEQVPEPLRELIQVYRALLAKHTAEEKK